MLLLLVIGWCWCWCWFNLWWRKTHSLNRNTYYVLSLLLSLFLCMEQILHNFSFDAYLLYALICFMSLNRSKLYSIAPDSCCYIVVFFSFAYNNLFILLQLRSFRLFMCFIFFASYDNIVVFSGHSFFVCVSCMHFFSWKLCAKGLEILFYVFFYFIPVYLSFHVFLFVLLSQFSIFFFRPFCCFICRCCCLLFICFFFFIFLLLLLLVSGFFPIDKLNKGNIELNR